MGRLVKYITSFGEAAVHAVDATDIVERMRRFHGTSATVSAALGRLLCAAALMGSMLKNEDDTVALKVDGGGSIGTLLAVSDGRCNVRGTCGEPHADLPLNPRNGKLDVGGIVGRDGSLSVIKTINGAQQTGSVALVSGEIAEDITSYFAVSEQIPTVCALGVLVDVDLSIRCAGGFILQLLPGADDETIATVENNLRGLKSVTEMMSEGLSIDDIAERALGGFGCELLQSTSAEYRCNCSRDKMYRVLKSLGAQELGRLADEQEITEIVCSYCNRKYEFTSDQLVEMAGGSQPS